MLFCNISVAGASVVSCLLLTLLKLAANSFLDGMLYKEYGPEYEHDYQIHLPQNHPPGICFKQFADFFL